MINIEDYEGFDLSVAMTGALDELLKEHLDRGPRQEDLAFALWRPSIGGDRITAVLQKVILPNEGDRTLHGNVSFSPQYVQRVLKESGGGTGIAFLHSHLGPGWQGMSDDDVIAEKKRLASAVAGATGLPLIGLTRGTDGSWSARFWLRMARGEYGRAWCKTVRVVGQHLQMTFHPVLMPPPVYTKSQVATVSVWGETSQAVLARIHVGIVGLGSVGSIVAEALSRVGVSRLTLIDHDRIEQRNLDRTLGSAREDADKGTPKVAVSERLVKSSHTAEYFQVDPFFGSILSQAGLKKALNCDVLFSCVDRPWPRHMLNAIAYSHLIPVVDGGIYAKVKSGHLINADWRAYIVGPGRACMVCQGALSRDAIALDMSGMLDDPKYIEGLGPEFDPLIARQNVFPFSMDVAAHEVLQFIGLVTGNARIGGQGSQFYHCYPGEMYVKPDLKCEPECQYLDLTASAVDLRGNIEK